ncbi:4-hydroxythreonine-4-phosphate dehydrogenase PdxA [Allosphingosinicella indica]|uniref:4-hydroxythreonine-4-phosphate dehydrogenase n=1 Tax=Allosphingosinicella indica TaxID=941907 RepID=A0A1X7H3K5_9SPHN|nr:4-hydroxythreonine-4-phosphate dehydrogenase PdxA [Allosphingosinicella indica]SMF78975.1 4-hydroxythreonine-4-phosphate dehydrogenase [Allosphingosinicella indica]
MTPLAVALGDPAGIGPEIIAKSWQERHTADVPPFFAVGDEGAVRAVWDGPVREISDPALAADAFHDALPILRVGAEAGIRPGAPDTDGARNSLDALEMATGLARSGAASGLVTGPVCKSQLYAIGFTHAGQTEFVAERCGVSGDMVAMMLVGPSLRTVPVTVHLPLRDVADALTTDLIVARGRATARGLTRQFGIAAPRIAVCGLNPHAGEDGALGREEAEIIVPAIERLRDEGIDVSGPYPADAMFHARARARYDAALCMYHDQALVPLKTLHFDEGVNMTLGLPIVRTSPDHGTAFSIAGQDVAHPGAMIAALKTAAACARRIGTA